MQLDPATISINRTAETSMQGSYAQTMKNRLYLYDLHRNKMIHFSDLIEYRIHFRFYVVNRYRISIPFLENPEIEITQTIVAP